MSFCLRTPTRTTAAPDVGKAAVEVLEAAGVHIDVADVTDSGRPAFSKGHFDIARKTAKETVDALAPRV
jgi:Fe-S oxidoreductase